MAETEEFEHGRSYGDIAGVVFYGPPINGFWTDCLAVSDRFIHPLFCAVLDRSSLESDLRIPRLASEWNSLEGWMDVSVGCVEIPPHDAQDLIEALGRITAADIEPHVAGATTDQCLRCASTIRDFISKRLLERSAVYIEDD